MVDAPGGGGKIALQPNYLISPSGTIHSSKGLEFEQVIINAQDFNMSKEGIISYIM